MTDNSGEIKKRIKLYNDEARLIGQVSASYADYLKAVKDFGVAQKEINKAQAELDDLIKKGGEDLKDLTPIEKARLAILKDVVKELSKQNEELGNAIKQTNALRIASTKMVASTINGIANIPGLLNKGFSKLKGYGLFEMDKAIKMSALQMGLLGKEGAQFSTTMQRVVTNNAELGLGVKEMAELQGNFNEALGRTVMLSDKGLVAMGQMSIATGLGADGVAQLAEGFDEVGLSVENTAKYINKSMDSSHKMGLNASKVVKTIQGNIKMLNKYNFKEGVKGLDDMAKLATKLGIKMDFATGMSDKLWDIEGAVDMSAQLQVMGGQWAKMADPFHLMYMARNDMKGLTEEIANASQESMHLAKDGSIEMSSVAMAKLKNIAKETGLEYDDLVKSGKELYKQNKVKQQIGFEVPDDMKEFIANTSQLDKNGKAVIMIKGDNKLVSQLDASDKRYLKTKVEESKTLADRIAASKNFDDDMQNIIMQVKTYMLPIIDGINDTLGPIIKDFMKDPKWKDSLYNLGKEMGEFVKSLKPFFETVGSIVKFLGPTGTLAVLFGGKMLFNALQWYSNGKALFDGFNSMSTLSKTGMGSSSSWSPGQTGPAAAGKGGWSMGTKAGLGLGLGVAGLGANYLTDKYTDEGSGANIGGKALSGALSGAAMGAMLGPWGMAGGALIGGLYGGITAAMKKPENQIGGVENEPLPAMPSNQPVQDALSQSGYNRGILAGGAITPISNKDSLMSYKPKGPIDNALNQSANNPSTMKIEFAPLTFNGSIMLTSPGNPGQATDLLKNHDFISNITQIIHVETQKQIGGGKVKG